MDSRQLKNQWIDPVHWMNEWPNNECDLLSMRFHGHLKLSVGWPGWSDLLQGLSAWGRRVSLEGSVSIVMVKECGLMA